MYNIFRILVEVLDYSSSFVLFFRKRKKYLGTTKGSTKMILVHVQKMYKTCYSSILFVFSKNEEEAIPPGGKKYLGTTKGSTRMI